MVKIICMCLTALTVLGVSFLLLLGCQSTSLSSTELATSSITPSNSIINKLSSNTCVVCHQNQTPGIIQLFSMSVMAQNGVTCQSCHEVTADYPGAESHNGTYILISPTPARCQACHATEVTQFEQSRHAIPAYVAVNGTQGLTVQQLAVYQAIPEGGYATNKSEHPLAAMEGQITNVACYDCHNIGKTNADGSVGRCQDCHLTHAFSLEQARKPETCGACHIGPDHPQEEIFQESAHGIIYATEGKNWNWDAALGMVTVKDMQAPTCATCHISSLGNISGTHDVGDRLTTYLFAQYSNTRPNADQNKQQMQSICKQCHTPGFVINFYNNADSVVSSVNSLMKQADDAIAPLQDKGLLTNVPFDDPIKFTYFDLWHNYGRTTKFGAWMDGPDYTQWHGVYGILGELSKLQQMAQEKLGGN